MRFTVLIAALAAAALPFPALAALPVGAKAPAFSTMGAKAGADRKITLREALRKGPVVLYFYPKAFTQGCTLEAHAFSEATDEFAKAGATVIGMSADAMPELRKFSREGCRDKFTVAQATPAIVKDYDVSLTKPDGSATGVTSRTSYVIDRSGRVVFVHSDMDWREHVNMTLAAVRALKRR
ncbi:peroxiredoxin [Parablastomonas sp. CN1-191]|uniref:peroxiredoxin n=1 Tax=Parablastomonas sp. CN1-191 TaxID=3400908 RepID=UPI003BF79628